MPAPDAAVRVAMVAGEASGDLLAGCYWWPTPALAGSAVQGIGGPRMAVEQGFQPWWPHDRLSAAWVQLGTVAALLRNPKMYAGSSKTDCS